MPFGSPRYLAAGGGSPRAHGPATPAGRRLPPVVPRRFGHRPPSARRYSGDLAVDFFSSGYLDVSVPRVVLPRPMCSAGGCRDSSRRVRPFGDPRVEGCVPLTADYRSLPRPSSASCAIRKFGYHIPPGAGPPATAITMLLTSTRENGGVPCFAFVDAESIISYLSLLSVSDRESVRRDPSLRSRYAALKVRGATPGTGRCGGARGTGGHTCAVAM